MAHLTGCESREQAQHYIGLEIGSLSSALPSLEPGDYYWRQLIGLGVFAHCNGRQFLLGRVSGLLETGANDVLVVRPCEDSLDERERLIPYVPGSVIVRVDLVQGLLAVNWDPEF